MKKTKVVCTMGPRTDDRNMMRALIKNGMDVARFNFSHGSYDEHKRRMDMLKQLPRGRAFQYGDPFRHERTGDPDRAFERRKKSNAQGE